MKIYIKNMVCIRCKKAVESVLEKLDIHFKLLELGEVETTENLSQEQLKVLGGYLRQSGLELIENKKNVIVEKIKSAIIELVHYSGEEIKVNLSDYLSKKLNYDYAYLSNLFSESQCMTIEKFFINHKIERVKELLIYSQLNLNEISFMTRYSSVAHLCNQFKKATGLAPSQYKYLSLKNSITREEVANATKCY